MRTRKQYRIEVAGAADATRAALELAEAALDHIDQGIILLDPDLNVQFVNRAMRALANISAEQTEGAPAFAQLVARAGIASAYDVPSGELGDYIAHRVALVRSGETAPTNSERGDGKIMRTRATVLPGGGWMITYTDVTDLVRRSDRLEHLATTDGLTGLYNRRHFLELAEAEWSRFRRYRRPLSLFMVDIDHFKAINDTHGHDIGDLAIIHLAHRCENDTRGADVAARFGGEEFVVLLPETDLDKAHLVAERLRKTMAERPCLTPKGEVPMTVSIGVAQADVAMPDIHALIKAADEALYAAKRGGRNRVVKAA